MRRARITPVLLGLLLVNATLSAAPPHDAVDTPRVFSVHDIDRDGYLNRQEYDQLLEVRRRHQAASGRPVERFRPPPAFSQIDADQDQLISAEELTAVLGRGLRLRQRQHQPENAPER